MSLSPYLAVVKTYEIWGDHDPTKPIHLGVSRAGLRELGYQY